VTPVSAVTALTASERSNAARVYLLRSNADDDLKAVAALLAEEGFVVRSDSIATALPEVPAAAPEVVLMHWACGIDAIVGLRTQRPLAIVVVCDVPEDGAGIEALDAGADDYVDTRCSADAVLARVRAHHRRRLRPAPIASPVRVCEQSAHFCVLPGGVASVDGACVELTRIEERLFVELVRHLSGEASKHELFAAGWPGVRVSEHTFHVRLSGLRAKLAEVGAAIVLTPLRGYQMVAVTKS
jgi:two-component system KDP operon response regulator KdpE